MNHHEDVLVLRSGYAGGMLVTLMLAVQHTNLLDGAIVAAVGAASSFATVQLMKWVSRLFKR